MTAVCLPVVAGRMITTGTTVMNMMTTTSTTVMTAVTDVRTDMTTVVSPTELSRNTLPTVSIRPIHLGTPTLILMALIPVIRPMASIRVIRPTVIPLRHIRRDIILSSRVLFPQRMPLSRSRRFAKHLRRCLWTFPLMYPLPVRKSRCPRLPRHRLPSLRRHSSSPMTAAIP